MFIGGGIGVNRIGAAGGFDAYAILGYKPGLVLDFDDEYYRANSAATTFAGALTHSASSNGTMVDSDGLLKWRPHNLVLNSASPATQSITVVSGADYTVECTGVSIALSGAGSGTVTEGSPVTITAGTTTLTLTVTGSSGTMWAYRSDLGGMVNNPDRGDSYVPTTSTARYLPRRGHHVYNGTSWVNEGLLHESEARTNLVTYSEEFDNASWVKAPGVTVTANTDVAPDGTTSADTVTSGGNQITQGVSCLQNTVYTDSLFFKKTTEAAYTPALYLIFTGGTMAIYYGAVINTDTGVYTVGTASGFTAPLAVSVSDAGAYWRLSVSGNSGNNTAVDLRMYPNFNPLTGGAFPGSQIIWGAQLEAGSTPSSYIPTSGSTATRSAETLTVPAGKLPYSATAMSIQMQGRATGGTLVPVRWYLDANNYITQEINTSDFTFEQAASGTVDAVTGGSFTSGVNTAFNIASRHGSTFVNGAVDGTALTANTTPTALPDLSATDMNLAYAGGPMVLKSVRMWAADITDAGLEAATV